MRYIVIAVLLFSGLAIITCSDNATNGPDVITFGDLTIHLTSMDPHLNNYMLFRVVDGNADIIRGVIVLDSLRGSDEDIEMPSSLADNPYRLDFFADFNNDGDYDAPPTDHAWSVDIPQNGIVNFNHNTNFTDISTLPATEPGNDFNLNLSGFTPHLNQLIEIRVIDVELERTVGVYRLDVLEAVDFTATIPGIIEDGREYQIDFYADLNASGTYNAPPTDHAWRLQGTGTASGLTVQFAHNTNFTDVDF